MDDEIVRRLVLEAEEDKVEFICIATMTEFLLLPQMKMPCRTSILGRHIRVTEMLEGHLQRIWKNLGIPKGPFQDLCNKIIPRGLWEDKPHQYVDVTESLAIYLFTFYGK